MKPLVISETYPAPVERVFDVYTDFANAADTISAITKMEVLTDGPIGLGTRWKETRVMFGKECTEEMEISAFEPNKRYEVLGNSCGAEFRTDIAFEPLSTNETKVTMSMSSKPQTFMAKVMGGLMGWMMTGGMKKAIKKDMEDIKTHLSA